MALRHRDYSVVVVDDCMAEANPAAADLLWQSFGMAVPVQINFAFSGGSRLAREVQAAIARREQQQVMALHAPLAAQLLENELEIYPDRALAAVAVGPRQNPNCLPKLAGKIRVGGRACRHSAPAA